MHINSNYILKNFIKIEQKSPKNVKKYILKIYLFVILIV